MQRFIVSVLFVLLFIPQTIVAAAPDLGNSMPEAAAATQMPSLKSNTGVSSNVQMSASAPVLTDIRYAVHTDAVTGEKKLRLVVDVTGPVEAGADIVSDTTPQLVVSIKANPGQLSGSRRKLDGQIAEQARLSEASGGSKLVIDLANVIDDNDYRLFTLPNDIKASRPFRVVIDINRPTPPVNFSFTAGLKNKVIAIDPGHGGTDCGAVGLNGTQEKTVTLAVAQKVRALLEKAGAKVVMTRQTDRDVYGPNASAVDELRARVVAAGKADIFVSIHANSFTDRSVNGTATYYYRKSLYDVMLAQSLQDNLIKAGNLTDRGISSANFYVIKRSTMPAALVELAFISNPNEEALLKNPDFQQRMAQGIYQGIDNFFVQAAKAGGGR